MRHAGAGREWVHHHNLYRRGDMCCVGRVLLRLVVGLVPLLSMVPAPVLDRDPSVSRFFIVSTKGLPILTVETSTRTHVVWKYDERRLDAFRAQSETIAAQENERALGDWRGDTEVHSEIRETCAGEESPKRIVDIVSIDVESTCSESDESWTPSQGPSGGGSPTDGLQRTRVQFAYEDESKVEYYSCHKDQWLLAVDSLAALHTEPLGRDSFRPSDPQRPDRQNHTTPL